VSPSGDRDGDVVVVDAELRAEGDEELPFPSLVAPQPATKAVAPITPAAERHRRTRYSRSMPASLARLEPCLRPGCYSIDELRQTPHRLRPPDGIGHGHDRRPFRGVFGSTSIRCIVNC